MAESLNCKDPDSSIFLSLTHTHTLSAYPSISTFLVSAIYVWQKGSQWQTWRVKTAHQFFTHQECSCWPFRSSKTRPKRSQRTSQPSKIVDHPEQPTLVGAASKLAPIGTHVMLVVFVRTNTDTFILHFILQT